MVKSPQFKAWFGDWEDPKRFTSRASGSVSHAFDHEAGVPLRLYHATGSDFQSFNVPSQGHNSNLFGSWPVTRHGIFMTPDLEAAHHYLPEKGGSVMPLYAAIHFPLDLDNLSDHDIAEFEQHGMNPRWIRNATAWEMFDGEDGKAFTDTAKKLGYDGAIFTENTPEEGGGRAFRTFVAFHPNQVKSATGNSGQFSADPDIAKSEIDHTETVAVYAVNPKGETLWGVRRKDGKWTVPGGHLDPNEDPEDGAVRELWEEAGVEPVGTLKHIGSARNGKGVLIHMFFGVVVGQPTPTNDPDNEFLKLTYVDCSVGLPEEVAQNLAHPDNLLLKFLGLQPSGKMTILEVGR